MIFNERLWNVRIHNLSVVIHLKHSTIKTMRNRFNQNMGTEQRRKIILHTAQAQANALHGMYRDTLGTFLTSPNAVPVPRAARAMFWLGRLRQWRAIDLDSGAGGATTNWLSLQLGVVESVAGTHALALHKEQWSGPARRQTYERDMSLQIAMLLTLGWNDLAAFVVHSWFHTDSEGVALNPIHGMAGMIIEIAGKALGITVPHASFQKTDGLLQQIVEHWQSDEAVFLPLIGELAERHLGQCRLDTDQSLFDFDHPVEQAMPVELLMLLRLRGLDQMPESLVRHAALAHPAAVLVQSDAPVQSQRCIGFVERIGKLLPQYEDLTRAISRQAALLHG